VRITAETIGQLLGWLRKQFPEGVVLMAQRVCAAKTTWMDGLMRVWNAIGIALALVGVAGSIEGVAQRFQEPTKEELQMTSDPKAPGAPAEFLYREEVTDNANHFISEYARIKILTEAGKEWATVDVPYWGRGTPPIITGRTIHADGSVVPLVGKLEDLLVTRNSRRHLNARVFNMPSVEVGSILEYKWTKAIADGEALGATSDMQGFMNSALASSTPYWDVQQDIPVRKERFYYNPLGDLEKNVIGNQSITHYNSDGEIASYLLFSAHLPGTSKVQVSPKPDYTLEIQDIPAFPHESDALPELGRRFGVNFYYTPYLAGEVFWNDESKRWARSIDKAAEPTSDLKAAAAQIVAGATTDEQKAVKLYDAVQALENTAFSREKSEAERRRLGLRRQVRNAQDVWAEKGGTRNEIATLYLALVRAAGLDAHPMAVADRSTRLFDPGYLSLDQLTATLVVLHLNGGDVFVDPGEKLMPFGQLAWSHSLCGGLRETADDVTHNSATPGNNAKDAITAHTADLTVDVQGGVTGTVKVLMNGPEALHWRQRNLEVDAAEAKLQLAELLNRVLPQGVRGEITTIQGLDTSAGYVSVTAKVSGPLGTPTGKRVGLPAFFFSTGPRPLFVAEDHRESPIDLHYAGQQIDDVVYHLPAGYSVESAPQPAQLPWPDHAVLVVKTQAGPGTIDVKHIFARAFVVLDPKEYPALRDYYQKVAASDQQQIVLAQGN
jgi:hypothetical protein